MNPDDKDNDFSVIDRNITKEQWKELNQSTGVIKRVLNDSRKILLQCFVLKFLDKELPDNKNDIKKQFKLLDSWDIASIFDRFMEDGARMSLMHDLDMKCRLSQNCVKAIINHNKNNLKDKIKDIKIYGVGDVGHNSFRVRTGDKFSYMNLVDDKFEVGLLKTNGKKKILGKGAFGEVKTRVGSQAVKKILKKKSGLKNDANSTEYFNKCRSNKELVASGQIVIPMVINAHKSVMKFIEGEVLTKSADTSLEMLEATIALQKISKDVFLVDNKVQNWLRNKENNKIVRIDIDFDSLIYNELNGNKNYSICGSQREKFGVRSEDPSNKNNRRKFARHWRKFYDGSSGELHRAQAWIGAITDHISSDLIINFTNILNILPKDIERVMGFGANDINARGEIATFVDNWVNGKNLDDIKKFVKERHEALKIGEYKE